jgi:hypothetical protein
MRRRKIQHFTRRYCPEARLTHGCRRRMRHSRQLPSHVRVFRHYTNVPFSCHQIVHTPAVRAFVQRSVE